MLQYKRDRVCSLNGGFPSHLLIQIFGKHYGGVFIMLSYTQYLSSKKWKQKRNEVINLQKSCQSCGSKENLQVHHKTYRNIGNELPEDLLLLCNSCHRKEHGLPDASEKFVKLYTSPSKIFFKNLTSKECRLLFYILQFVNYDGKLKHSNGKELTREYIGKSINLSLSSVDKIIALLATKDIIRKQKHGRKVMFSVNEELLNKGKERNDQL